MGESEDPGISGGGAGAVAGNLPSPRGRNETGRGRGEGRLLVPSLIVGMARTVA
jgi:hypothetical protein